MRSQATLYASLFAASSLLLSACSVTVTEQMIVSPSTEIDSDNLATLTQHAGYQESFINTSQGENLHTLTLIKDPAEPTILVLHGNALNMTLQPWFGLLETLSELPFNVVAIDYQGFGLSSGEASFSAMRDDAKSLLHTLGQDTQIVVYGLSLGSVMAMDISQDSRIQGVILEGGVTTDKEMIEVFRQRNALGGLANVQVQDAINFDNTGAIKALNKPVLVIHGDNDNNIPSSMGEQLYAASDHANSQLYLVEGGGHTDTFYIDKQSFQREVTDFINQLSAWSVPEA